MTTTTLEKTQIFQSRWGFHPVDYEEFLFLKKAHQLLFHAYCDVKKYKRWYNKDPQNRKGPEPRVPDGFVETGYHKCGAKVFYGKGFRRYGRENLYHHILEEYRYARIPHAAEYVRPLDLPDDLDQIIEQLEQFYGE